MMRKDWIRLCHHTPICGKNHLSGSNSLFRMTNISWLDAGGPHDTVVLPETKCIWGSLFRRNHPVIWRGDLRTPSTQGEKTTSLDFAMKQLSTCAPFRNTNQVDVPNVLKNKKIMTKDFKHKRDKIVKTVLTPHLTKELQLCQDHVLPGLYDFFFKMFVEMSVNRHSYTMCQLWHHWIFSQPPWMTRVAL